MIENLNILCSVWNSARNKNLMLSNEHHLSLCTLNLNTKKRAKFVLNFCNMQYCNWSNYLFLFYEFEDIKGTVRFTWLLQVNGTINKAVGKFYYSVTVLCFKYSLCVFSFLRAGNVCIKGYFLIDIWRYEHVTNPATFLL